MNKLISLLLIICTASPCFASYRNEEIRRQAFYASVDCRKPYLIERGNVAPCSGYIFSKELEEKIRTDLVYKDSLIKNLTEASDAQAEIIRISNNQLDLYKQEVAHQKHVNTMDKILYAGLGLLAGYVGFKTLQR